MAEIVGTITNLSDFLSKTQVCLSVKPNDPQQQIICLEADRKYSIPAFQREVRWDDNNLKMLLYDLSRSSKFLGKTSSPNWLLQTGVSAIDALANGRERLS